MASPAILPSLKVFSYLNHHTDVEEETLQAFANFADERGIKFATSACKHCSPIYQRLLETLTCLPLDSSLHLAYCNGGHLLRNSDATRREDLAQPKDKLGVTGYQEANQGGRFTGPSLPMSTSTLGEDLSDHPYLEQLTALKQAYDRVQEELHRNSARLQAHFHQASSEHDRIHDLELENKLLREELAALRQTPHPSTLPQSHPAVSQVQQLTLSLRKLSDQLTHTEASLLTRTTELTHARSDLNKAKIQEEKAYELAARIRGREEALSARVHEMEWKVKEAEEREKMAEVVIGEYANLVRKLEGRAAKKSASEKSLPNGSAGVVLEDGLTQGKLGLKRLMGEMEEEISGMRRQLESLQVEKEELVGRVEVLVKAAEADRAAKGQADFELDKMKVDDNTAAKMVSRYMKFSQAQTDSLQTSIASIQARHSATLSTLHSQIYNLTNQLHASQASLARFQNALEELNGDIMKETYGRRNEVALRMKMLGREERIAEGLRRLVLKADKADSEILEMDENKAIYPALETAFAELREDVKTLLESFDNPLVLETSRGEEVEASASVGRLVTAQFLVDDMKEELQKEVALRLRAGSITAKSGLVSEQLEADANGSNAVHHEGLQPPPQDKPLPSSPHAKPPSPPAPPIVVLSSHAQETSDLLSELESLELEALGARIPSSGQTSAADTSTSGGPSPMDPQSSATPNKVDTPSPNAANSPDGELENEEEFPGTPVASTVPTLSVSSVPGTALHDEPEPPSKLLQPAKTLLLAPTPGSGTPASDSPTTAGLPPAPSHRPPPLPLDRPDGEQQEPQVGSNSEGHPLIARLAETAERYDTIQRSFRDCHLALQSLRTSISSSCPPTTASPSRTPSIPREVLEAVIERLDDFVEDTRVEIEIRKGDESVLARGFEVILRIPGALPTSGFSNIDTARGMPSAGIKSPSALNGFSSPMQSTLSLLNLASPRTSNDPLPASVSGMTMKEVEEQIEAFVDGTEPSVRKAVEGFTRKLEDVQHDIARVKTVVFSPESPVKGPPSPSLHPDSASIPEPQHTPTPDSESNASSGLLYPTPRHASSSSGSSSSWTSWLRNASSPLSAPPRPTSPAESFGNIMTSPRLRHSPSLTNSLKRRSSATPTDSDDVLGALQLRVPMPKFSFAPPASGTGTKEDANTKTPAQLSASRARTISTLGMGVLGGVSSLRTASASGMRLGPGALRSSSSAFFMPNNDSRSGNGISTPPAQSHGGTGHRRKPSYVERDIDGDTDMEMDSEVETEPETETETEGGGSDSDFD
ncbi:hypothetical protein NMY22_g5510 [Coprinellus aureogranulatus]|nr:hypothetical protein NMY22_g5510 [Coprinellus aureogranulatus]